MENVLTNGRQTIRKINERFRHLVSSSGKRRKTDNKQKAERSREEDRREGGNQTGLKDQYISLFHTMFLSYFFND